MANQSNPRQTSPFGLAFFAILLLKLAVGALLGSHFIRDLTSPFVQWTLQNMGQDPWTAFLEMDRIKAFPYHLGMLASLLPVRLLMSIFPDPGWQVTTWVDLMALRLPLLAADILIFTGLIRLTQMPRNKALWVYWANPIVFYISYMHGQLDIIPVAWAFGALWLLRKSLLPWAAVALGVSMGTKSTALLLLPVMAIYVYRNQGLLRASLFGAISLATAALLVLPMTGSAGYQTMVLGAEEQFWLLRFSLWVPGIQLPLFLAPMALLLVYLKLASLPRINFDLAMAFVGLTTVIFLGLVPPMPGWYMWLIPAVVYLWGIGRGNHWLSMTTLGLSYLVYFILFAPTADGVDMFQTGWGPLLTTTLPLRPSQGLWAFLPGLSLTGLTAALLFTAYELWRSGIASNEVYRRTSAIVVGLAGDSAAGKDTLCRFITQVLGPRRTLQLDGDDYHRWARHDPRYARFSHLHPAANRLHEQAADIQRLARGETVQSPKYDHGTGHFTDPVSRSPREFILVSGLHTFLLSQARHLLDLRIYLTPSAVLRAHWKLLRDTQQRAQSPSDVQQQMDSRTLDSAEFVQPQQTWADLTFKLALRDDKALEDYIQHGESALKLTVHSGPRFDWNAPIALLSYEAPHLDLHLDLGPAGSGASIQVSGELSSQAVENVAKQLIPNLHEFAQVNPVWEPGLNGIMQLFVVHSLAQVCITPDSPLPAPNLGSVP